jgi:polyhydroxyalkanoate synthase
MDWVKLFSRASDVLQDRIPVEIGTSPADTIWTENKCRVIRYRGGERKFGTPVFLMPSMVNRHTLYDLTDDNSVALTLVRAGFDVFLLDWGRCGPEDRCLSAAHYVDGLTHRAVRAALAASGAKSATLVGYCMGGTLALVYAALHPETVRNAVLLATPVDFDKAGKLRLWADPAHFEAGAFRAAWGNAPHEILHRAFGVLEPTWQVRQWLVFARFGENDLFLRQFAAMGKWVKDNVDVPGQVFEWYVRQGYQQNRLVKGGLRVGDRDVSLKEIRAAVLTVAASKDHLVPCESSTGFGPLLGTTDYKEKVFDCGHVGLSVGAQAQPIVWPYICHWLSQRS